MTSRIVTDMLEARDGCTVRSLMSDVGARSVGPAHAGGRLLDGKVAVITGAGSGMAKASVRVFVREGAKVVAADISGAEQDTAAEVGGGVLPVHCDVTKEADVEALMAAAVEEFGRVDAVLNVAGIADGCLLTELTMEFYDRLMDVDLRGVMLGMKHGIRTMLKTGGGSVVNWSSVGGLNGSAYTSVYQAAKTGSSVPASRLPSSSARRASGSTRSALGSSSPRSWRGRRGLHPGHRRQGRPQPRGLPAEAPSGAFLASDRASFVTGAVIPATEVGRPSWRSSMDAVTTLPRPCQSEPASSRPPVRRHAAHGDVPPPCRRPPAR